jgi:hypothetical protein
MPEKENVMERKLKRTGIFITTAIFATVLLISDEVSSKSGATKTTADTAALAINTKTAAEKLFVQSGLAEAGLPMPVFLKAYAGYAQLKAKGLVKKELLSIADMSTSSGNRRLYIVDMLNGKMLKHTWVAHGRNSGDRMAMQFSNKPSSLQSSLGFYVTSDTYTGNNGYSLRLVGLEKGFNDNALSRAIVMHGAAYVNEQLASTGRIGRSWGCPAVSQKEHKEIIDLLKGGSCLFIYAEQPQYLSKSTLLNNSTTL